MNEAIGEPIPHSCWWSPISPGGGGANSDCFLTPFSDSGTKCAFKCTDAPFKVAAVVDAKWDGKSIFNIFSAQFRHTACLQTE